MHTYLFVQKKLFLLSLHASLANELPSKTYYKNNDNASVYYTKNGQCHTLWLYKSFKFLIKLNLHAYVHYNNRIKYEIYFSGMVELVRVMLRVQTPECGIFIKQNV